MKQLIYFVVLLTFISCATTKKNSIWSDKDCKLERLEYQEITDTIHRTVNGGVEGGVTVNGKAIISDKINLDSVKAYLNAGNKVFISQSTFKTVKVTQEFYQKYSDNRAFLCQTMELMKLKGVSAETKAEAEKVYLDIIKMNSGLNNEKKKNG